MQIDPNTRAILAPTGQLRVGIAVGNAISSVWTKRGAPSDEPRGPTVDLAKHFADRIGTPLTLVEYGSSAAIIEAASRGSWDVSFTPVDSERKAIVDFGPNFALGESTYMVSGPSGIRDLAGVDREGVRIFGVEGTATLRAARKTLKRVSATGLTELNDVLDRFRNGKADAIALGKESLVSLLAEFPEARILDEHFFALGTALAVPKGNKAALDVFSALLEDLKADGTVRAIFDRHGMTATTVAPAGSYS